MKRIINIHTANLDPNQMLAFHYRLQDKEEIVGLMSSPEMEVSLAVKGGTKLLFESLPLGKSIHTAPKSNILPFRSKSNFIKGSVRNKANNKRKTNLYLIIQ